MNINPTVAVDKYAQNCFVPVCVIAPMVHTTNVTAPVIPNHDATELKNVIIVSVFVKNVAVSIFVFHNNKVNKTISNPL